MSHFFTTDIRDLVLFPDFRKYLMAGTNSPTLSHANTEKKKGAEIAPLGEPFALAFMMRVLHFRYNLLG